jgi:hypothetical protein
MRKLILPVAAAALALVALDAAPAKAQVVIVSGYSSLGYYGGYSPYYYGGSGIGIGSGRTGMYPAYSGFGYPSYSPYYGGGYSPYYGMGYRSNYGGWYGYPGYSGGYRGGWRR